MKIMKTAVVALCCIAATLFTSCLSEDEMDAGLTPAEKTAALNAVKGTYKGMIIYPKADDNGNDSLAITWEIKNDTTLTIRNFPVNLLATRITNTNIAKGISDEQPRDMKCHIVFGSASPVTFFVNPEAQSFSLYYGEAYHLVQIAMMTNNIFSFASYDATSQSLQMQIVEAGIYVNGILQGNMLTSSTPFMLEGNKQ